MMERKKEDVDQKESDDKELRMLILMTGLVDPGFLESRSNHIHRIQLVLMQSLLLLLLVVVLLLLSLLWRLLWWLLLLLLFLL